MPNGATVGGEARGSHKLRRFCVGFSQEKGFLVYRGNSPMTPQLSFPRRQSDPHLAEGVLEPHHSVQEIADCGACAKTRYGTSSGTSRALFASTGRGQLEHEPVLAKCGLAEPATRLGVFEESRRGLGNRDRSSLRFFGQRVPRPARLPLDG
jgi:hypothetical protein